MALSEDIAELFRRWRELQNRKRALAQEEERLIAAMEARLGTAAAVPQVAETTEEEEEEEEADEEGALEEWIRRYTPPQEGMKPHEYVFHLVEKFGVIEYAAACHWIYDDNDTPKNRRKLRNILAHLRDAGRILNTAHNHWRVRAVGERKR